jgi:hypothetical protein
MAWSRGSKDRPAGTAGTVAPQPPIDHSFFLSGMTHMFFSLSAGFALIHGGQVIREGARDSGQRCTRGARWQRRPYG